MPLPQTAQEVIKLLSLTPHPEGGYYRETYRDPNIITSNTSNLNFPSHAVNIQRSPSSAIYFLLEGAGYSRLHRIDAAEVWHFYGGTSALEVVELTASGPRVTRLGMDLLNGEAPQYTVPEGTWFGARIAEDVVEANDGNGTGWALVGCTVAPAFSFDRFQMGERRPLEVQFPKCAEVVKALTPSQ